MFQSVVRSFSMGVALCFLGVIESHSFYQSHTYYVGLRCAALEAGEDRFEFSGGRKCKPVNMT